VSRALATVLAGMSFLATAMPVTANDPAPPTSPVAAAVVPGEVLVKWRDADRAADVAREHGLAIVAELGDPGAGGHPSVVSTGRRSVEAVLAELRSDPEVAYAEPSYVVSLAEEVPEVSVDDPMTAGQYSLDRMRIRDAWSLSTGGSNVVAVLDTGVQRGHPDLTGRVLRGYDFVNDDTSASDDNGHGTWVAGIIAANANDGYGIAGISWSDKILPVKIMNGSGTGSTADLAAGIVWAADAGADIINMSVGGFPYSAAVFDAVTYAWNKGAILVAAAGNNNRREDFYPASYSNVVSVSATQVDDEFSHWSSYGPKVDVSAPGSSVQTTNCTASACPHRDWGSHTYISGTSFATPNVAGVVALMLARYPEASPSEIVNRLLTTVDDRGYTGRDDRYGVGRVNAYRALGAAVAAPARLASDGLESNNSLQAARDIALGTTVWPTIYPAGDADWFAVAAPRAGRLDIRVTGVVDSRAYPWNRSSLPVDPIVELWSPGGTFIKRVDNEWESGTELAQHTVSSAARVVVRIANYYANGNRTAYSVRATFVDTVAPTVTQLAPAVNAADVSQWVVPAARFSERVQNVSSSTVRIRDMESFTVVPAEVTYDSALREARITPATRLEGNHAYRFELGSGITDMGGNAIPSTRVAFTTSNYSFRDIAGTPFATEIEWMVASEITRGCETEAYCPLRELNRGEMATFLARALKLPPATRDYFTDDNRSAHQDAINRLAEAGITRGCDESRYCPWGTVRRGAMASFLARALDLPSDGTDYFVDDEGLSHEANINRVAAAGITTGCDSGMFCPLHAVNRQQIAGFLFRALTD
jgi:serine protease